MISYSPSIFQPGAYEVLSENALVGFIEPAGNDYTAHPLRAESASFSTLAAALGYFKTVFVDEVKPATKNQPTNQLQMF